MLAAVVALEIGAGPADDAVLGRIGVPVAVPAGATTVVAVIRGVGIAPGAQGRGRDGRSCADGSAGYSGGSVRRPESSTCPVVPIRLSIGRPPIAMAAGVGTAGSLVQAVGAGVLGFAGVRIVDN